MVRKRLLTTTIAAALFVPTTGYADIKVRFVNPERYTDAGSFGAHSLDATLAEFRAYFEKLGTIFLTPDQNLTIDVLNIDLAGDVEPWRREFPDARIMRDITPPSFRLRYVLTEKGKPTRSGEVTLADPKYQMNTSARLSTFRYAYEKALLDDWFRRNFSKAR